MSFPRNLQLYKFSAYGFLKNLRFFDPVILLFFREMGMSYFRIGMLFSVREITINLFEIPSGLIADNLGHKNSMVFSFSSYIVSFLIFYFSGTFSLFLAAMIFFGIGEAFRSGTHKAMILTYLKLNKLEKFKVDYYGFTRSWSLIGSSISALLTGLIVISMQNYRFVFLFTVLPYILGLLLMISYPEELNGDAIKDADWTKNLRLNFVNSFRNFLGLFRNIFFRKALVNSSVYDGFFKAVKDYIQPIIKLQAMTLPIFFYRENNEVMLVSFIYFTLYLLNAAAAVNSGRIMRKFADLRQAVDSAYWFGISMILISGIFLILNKFILSIIFFMIFFILQNIRRPMLVAFLSEKIPAGITASGLSAESQAKTIVTAITAPLMGILADSFGIGISITLLSLVVLMIFPMIKLYIFSSE